MFQRILIVCACLLAASATISRAARPGDVPARTSLAALPINLGEWQGQSAPPLSDSIMEVLGVDDYADRFYLRPGSPPLTLYVGYYSNQRQGRSIHSPLNCLPGSGWNPVKREYLQVPVPGGAIEVNRIVILKGLDKRVTLYWYQSHGRSVASEYRAKAYSLLDAMRTGRTDAALVRIITPTESLDAAAEEAATTRAVEFAQLLYPLLNRYVPD